MQEETMKKQWNSGNNEQFIFSNESSIFCCNLLAEKKTYCVKMYGSLSVITKYKCSVRKRKTLLKTTRRNTNEKEEFNKEGMQKKQKS